ncbi:MAG TPA: Stf0 family sulfotransferase [Stellaceae bacterium]|jgi:LPS sulfotransferase NodH|nr:Stf0 family sulfotransferase [Stellaceae bacterium]
MSFDGKLRAQFASFHGKHPAEPYRRPALPVKQSYCILITPRSGSTWLCRRMARLDVLSCPTEHFNADAFATTLKYNPGRDIYEVFDLIAAKNCTNTGIFGFKISYFDLAEFEREAPLLDVMPPGEQHIVTLRRENFVAQAISLHVAVESQMFHAIGAAPESLVRPPVPYDDNRIMYWACHILQQEHGIARWLQDNKVTPLALTYEELVEDVDAAIGRIAARLGVDLSAARAREMPQAEKFTADRTGEYEARFRAQHPRFCRRWAVLRGRLPCLVNHAIAEDPPCAAA